MKSLRFIHDNLGYILQFAEYHYLKKKLDKTVKRREKSIDQPIFNCSNTRQLIELILRNHTANGKSN